MDYANITNTLQSFVVTTFYYIIRLLLSPLLLCHIRAIRIRFDQILLDFLRPFGSEQSSSAARQRTPSISRPSGPYNFLNRFSCRSALPLLQSVATKRMQGAQAIKPHCPKHKKMLVSSRQPALSLSRLN